MDGQLNPETVVKRLAQNLASNSEQIDQKKLKTLKNLIRGNSDLVEHLISGIYNALKSSHPDTRIGAVLLAEEFFQRSAKFRELLIDDFQDFLVYSAETDPLNFPIPPPQDRSKALKLLTLKTVRNWHEKFGPAYSKLELAYRFLKQNKCLDIERLEAETETERKRKAFDEERKQKQRLKLAEKISDELEEVKEDMERCKTEMSNALDLIYPILKSSGGGENNEKKAEEKAEQLDTHGIGNTSIEIRICDFQKPEILESENNQALIQCVKDNARQIHVAFLPKLNGWLKNLAKIGGSQDLTKQLIRLKAELNEYLAKFSDLKLVKEVSEHSDDDDLEEFIDKEGVEEGNPEEPELIPDYIKEHTRKVPNPEDIPSTSKSSCREPETDDNNRSEVPKLSFGLDLKYWGEEIETPSIVSNNCDSHRFWRPNLNEGESNTKAVKSVSDAFRTRVMTFVGEFKPDMKECRAVLPNNKGICSRRHQSKCPLHGLIIDRDDEGNPIGPEKPSTSKKNAPQSHWQPDADLMRDIEAGTGRTLASPVKKKRKQEKSSRERLQDKLFDKKSLRRVGDTLDAMQKARATRKHEHQFNYSISK